MRITRYIIALILIVNLLTCGISFTDEKHWVYDELADFKQLILPVVKTLSANGITILAADIYNYGYTDYGINTLIRIPVML